ncbi:MAG: M4 family metallopeptidase [Gammaproteobacteria bacterium]|nr:M4 family metallopeptidase [Gammaproteobacteria bacterium]
MSHNCASHPLQCIVPPHMLESIKLRGSAKQRKMALAMEKQCDKVRGLRTSMATPGIAPVPSISGIRKPRVRREVYDGQHKASLPGVLVRDEKTGASGDKQVDQAFVGSGHVYNLYSTIYARDSLDGNGMTLISTVHHRRNYNNAFWDGKQMAYGDGDGELFQPLTNSLSVIGHEFAHGVIQFSGGLIYQDQSGALNESIADVFGVLTVQHKKKQAPAEANWLVGDGILGNDISGEALRSLRAPGEAYSDPVLGKDPQPYHMDFYNSTSSDYGGVHINSGIPNHAFFLLAQYLGGPAWEKAGRIWYDALQSINNPHATFFDWALETLSAANLLFGSGSRESLFTRRAWKLVGLPV